MAKKGPKTDDASGAATPRVRNRRARFDYEILEKVECGMELTGTEVKSLRDGNGSLEGAYAAVRDGQVYLCGANIATYPHAKGVLQHEPLRDRRLLLHRRQIARLIAHTASKGHTLIPLAMYFKNGWAKCEVGAAVGKRAHDKRRTIQDREHRRDMQREQRRRR